MKVFITIALVCLAALVLMNGGVIAENLPIRIHQNPFVNNLAKYQLIALAVGMGVMIPLWLWDPKSKALISMGDWQSFAEKEKWLGISGKSSWLLNGMQLLFFSSLATVLFMFSGLVYTNSLHNFQIGYIPLILLFSATNSFAEEMVFRFGIVAGLKDHLPKTTVIIVSAVLFGLPHYYGYPGGVIGVVMSGVLGYILCKATMETGGMSIALLLHFIQDIIIFTALMMMNTLE